jgi:hypothetical protein
MKNHRPFSDNALRRELLDRLNRIPGVVIPAESQWPRIPLTTLVDKAAMDQFLAVLDWAISEIRKSQETK